MSEIKMYMEDNGEWKECELLTGEELAQQATELLRENERLNNIINELEKWLCKKEKSTFNSWNKGIHEVQRKLQELKRSA